MRDQSIESVSKVPLLGDIPIVGWLFKNTTKTVSKVNLLFPYLKSWTLIKKTVGERVQTNLKQRASHLKFETGAQDPFGKRFNLFMKKQRSKQLVSSKKALRYSKPNKQ